jgi:hypothetical protein
VLEWTESVIGPAVPSGAETSASYHPPSDIEDALAWVDLTRTHQLFDALTRLAQRSQDSGRPVKAVWDGPTLEIVADSVSIQLRKPFPGLSVHPAPGRGWTVSYDLGLHARSKREAVRFSRRLGAELGLDAVYVSDRGEPKAVPGTRHKRD